MIGRPRTGIETFDTYLIYHPNMQIVGDAYLTRQTRVVTKVALCCKDRPFSLTNFARVAAENLDAACRAASISATAMEDVDAVILDRQNELFARLCLKRNGAACSFGGDLIHQKKVSKNELQKPIF